MALVSLRSRLLEVPLELKFAALDPVYEVSGVVDRDPKGNSDLLNGGALPHRLKHTTPPGFVVDARAQGECRQGVFSAVAPRALSQAPGVLVEPCGLPHQRSAGGYLGEGSDSPGYPLGVLIGPGHISTVRPTPGDVRAEPPVVGCCPFS